MHYEKVRFTKSLSYIYIYDIYDIHNMYMYIYIYVVYIYGRLFHEIRNQYITVSNHT